MRYLILLFMMSLLGIHPVFAQIEGQFVRPDSVFMFGNAVSMSGNLTLVANSIPNFSSVWVMENTSGIWSQVDEVEALEEESSQVFGHSVAIHGTAAVVGAPSFNYNGASNGGIAYVYEASGGTWAGAAALTPDDVDGQDEFGLSVDIDDNVLIVGSHKADRENNDNAGAAYVFRKSGVSWIQEALIQPADSFLTGRLGTSVSISGNYAIAGGPLEIKESTIVGSAYIYEYADTAWVQAARLQPDQPSIIESFGVDVEINGDVAMVGATGAVNGEIPTGAVYVYNRVDGLWTFTQRILASDGGGSDEFGRSVDFDGNCAVIGAFNSNKAYIFLYDGTAWVEEAILSPTNGEFNNGFGFDVSVSEGNVIVGTLGIFIDGTGGGGAFLYDNLCERVATSNESESVFHVAHDLHQNFPNPFSEVTTIQFNIEQPAHVRLTVYNVLGQEVTQLKEGFHGTGSHIVTWNRSQLASGLYIYAMDIDGVRVATKRVVVR